jgi:hypothetical protein
MNSNTVDIFQLLRLDILRIIYTEEEQKQLKEIYNTNFDELADRGWRAVAIGRDLFFEQWLQEKDRRFLLKQPTY